MDEEQLMRYISNTAADKESMLKEIGVDSIEARLKTS